jgi:two-component system CheB/CheR fusion protein
MTTSKRSSAAGQKAAPKPEAAPPAAFPIVGIGASAGGLAAVEQFLAALPAGGPPRMALVLVQHLDPDHKSFLLDLVKKYTDIEVAWAEDGVEVLPGRGYIMPPNTEMVLAGGRLVLTDPESPRGQRLPINHFFRSLAADQGERAVCVVLSGTGSDGTLGVRAVKGEGGMAVAQTPETADYDGMPRSAIATGLIDFVLAPAEMPGQILEYASRAFARAPQPDGAAPGTPDPLPEVLRVLYHRCGHDFSHYRRNTLRRRVERRMAVRKLDLMQDYVALLDVDSNEVETLFRELLIGVTQFFRDPPAFEAVAAKALSRLIAAHDPGDPVRVWVPACSTGEEAYSIAMLLQEQARVLQRHVPAQVFGTDIDADAIERARAASYPDTISVDVSPERLARYFVRDGSAYVVAKRLRDTLVFAKQDVTKDPPFSRVDMISCRNLLIYMENDLQQQLMPLFHYALNPDGYLLLGSSETVGASADLFATVDKKWRLYQRRGTVTPRRLLPTSTMPPARAATQRPPLHTVSPQVGLRLATESVLLLKHAPACVVVDAAGDVLYIHGHTGRYLEPAPGAPSGSLVAMVRQGLRRELVAGMRTALAQNEPVRFERLRVKTDRDVALVNLVVEPMTAPGAGTGALLVLFEDAPDADAGDGDVTAEESVGERERRIADLDRELSAKEEYLRMTVEELETSNEELMSSNEELMSSNEELQSTDEEMDTSREELQSVNEELVTVNLELQQRNDELAAANDDMSNMFAGTGIGTLFVDRHLLISRFTPGITEIMNVIPADVGRPLSDITQRLEGDTDLVSAATAVLDTLSEVDVQVVSGGRTYQMRAQPYRALEGSVEGAVLTFVDITEQQLLQARLDELARAAAEAGELAQNVLDTVREPQLVLDGELTVVTANKSFLATFQGARDEIVGRPLREVYDGAWLEPDLHELLLQVLPRKKLGDYRLRLTTGALGPCTLTLNALELLQTPDKRRLILLTVTAIDRET